MHCAGCSCSQRQPRPPVPKPLRRCTTGTCKLHGETAKAHETPKHFCFDQCGQQGCNFCESSIWASWNLPALLAEQSRLVTSMWAGMRLEEPPSSPGQPEELANSLRQIPGVRGDLPRPSGTAPGSGGPQLCAAGAAGSSAAGVTVPLGQEGTAGLEAK